MSALLRRLLPAIAALAVLAANAADAQAPRTKAKQPAAPAPAAPAVPVIDAAYAAFQRGEYLAAFAEATKRVEEAPAPAAMTLLGELYANGLGVKIEPARAAEW